MAKDMFDTFWDQNIRSIGGFTSLNQKDEECLKKVMRSLVPSQETLRASATNTQVVFDYDRFGAVVYEAVKAAMSETLPTRLHTYAVPEAPKEHRAAVDMGMETLPAAFFKSEKQDNLSSAKAETVESTGVADTIQALKRLKGE
jgi:hypothetical protein